MKEGKKYIAASGKAYDKKEHAIQNELENLDPCEYPMDAVVNNPQKAIDILSQLLPEKNDDTYYPFLRVYIDNGKLKYQYGNLLSDFTPKSNDERVFFKGKYFASSNSHASGFYWMTV